ncbi:hypothetical protein L7F22_040845 [Adiantum nelumboides]|nr:hypothetical protein [Adiantum nelumboides]
MATWYADVKDDIGTDVNKSVAKNSDVWSQVLSGLQGSPASSHVANPWSGRLGKEVSCASSIDVSRKGKEKADEGMRMPNDVEPTCFGEAAKNDKWQEAMNEEMDALNGNETWELVPLLKGKKPIGCGWVYKVKHNSDGSVSSYKARLVAKGYAHTYGISYEEMFAHVSKMATIRAVIAVATAKGWILHQMDVKNSFLHGDLQEEMYMEQPPGFQNTSYPNHVCKLQKALYGLNQAPRAWHDKIAQYLITIGFHMADVDHSLYVQKQMP